MAQISFRSGNSIIGLITSVLFILLAFYALKWLLWVLTYIAPVLLIVTLIIDAKVVTDYLKMLWNLLKTTPFFGVLCCGLSIFASPVIIFYLFGKMLFIRQVKKFKENLDARYNTTNNFEPTDNQGFTPYEEIETKLLDREEIKRK